MSAIGHNNPPRDRSFKKRWAFAVFDHPTKPAGAVALAFKLYMEMDSSGKGAVISDREFVEATGCSERSCQNFKRWLIEEEFIHIHVKGARGRANEFVAHIPEGMTAIDATIPKQPSAPITGKVENERQPLPIVMAGMAAIDADNRAIAATVADSAKNLPCAPAHAEENNNIYNNYNNLTKNTPTTSEQVVARETPQPPAPSANAVGGSPREGETYLGHGVYVNCETIRHADFTISLLGIEMQLLGTVPMADIKQIATGHALQWALDLEAGKRNVVPSNTANFIRGSIQNRKNNDAVTDVRKARASSRHVPRPDGKSFADLNNEILAEIEQERRR